MNLNLHATVRGAITSINSDIPAQYSASTGYTTDATFAQVPAYAAAVPVRVQSQPLSTKDLQHIEGMNLQGVLRKVYAYGMTDAVVRENMKGGDLFTFSRFPGQAAQTWKVVEVSEQFPTWVSFICVLQVDT